MTVAESRPRAHIPLCPGPRLDQPWTVTSGMVAVVGETETLTFPPGATWPGLDALPEDWLGDFQPSETLAVSDSQWQRAAPESLPAGVALVQAQLLRTGPLAARLTRLDRSGVGAMNQGTQAALIGARRESVAKVRGEMRRGA